jgi:hypothetical protein
MCPLAANPASVMRWMGWMGLACAQSRILRAISVSVAMMSFSVDVFFC